MMHRGRDHAVISLPEPANGHCGKAGKTYVAQQPTK